MRVLIIAPTEDYSCLAKCNNTVDLKKKGSDKPVQFDKTEFFSYFQSIIAEIQNDTRTSRRYVSS